VTTVDHPMQIPCTRMDTPTALYVIPERQQLAKKISPKQ